MNPNGASPLVITIPLACIAGLFIGSFLNVVIYRVPLGLSIASPRSFCPNCLRQLSWWENVPLVSWLGLRGRCRTCSQSVSVRYPLIELATGATFGLLTWGWKGSVLAIAYCLLAATMIAVALIEFGGERAPVSVAAIGVALAEVTILAGAGYQSNWRMLVGSLVGLVVAFSVYSLSRVSDPDCEDPRAYGRSALLVAGCWVGGLETKAFAWAIGVWIIVYFLCMLGSWLTVHPRIHVGTSSDTAASKPFPILGVPLVTALSMAMVASLLVAL